MSAAAVALAVSTAALHVLPLRPAPTQPVTVEVVLAGFESFDAGLKTLSAGFKQQVRWLEAGNAPQAVEGTLDYAKPGKLRLVHKKPEPQTMVSDGSTLWIHRKATNQVIKTRFEDWKQSEPLAQGLLDFGRYAQLLKNYQVELSSGAPGPDGHVDVALALRPKGGKAKDFTLTLKLSTRDYFPTETSLVAGSVAVVSSFSNIRYNSLLADELFTFTPPPGADVFDNFKPPRMR